MNPGSFTGRALVEHSALVAAAFQSKVATSLCAERPTILTLIYAVRGGYVRQVQVGATCEVVDLEKVQWSNADATPTCADAPQWKHLHIRATSRLRTHSVVTGSWIITI